MKFTVAILACVIAAASAQFNNGQYKPFGKPAYNAFRSYTTPAPYRTYRPVPVSFAPTPAPIYVNPTPVPVSVARVVADARNAETVRFGNEINPDGSFNYFYETSNGIAAQEQGVPRDFGGNPPVVPVVAQGSFSWTSPEGKPVAITYIADENGYQPSGDAIPTPPAVPAQIARALEYTARYLGSQKK